MPSNRALFLQSAFDRLGKNVSGLARRLPTGAHLVHYTDLSGLIGIVSDDDLWLTNARYSNDQKEIAYGMGLASDIVEKAAKVQRSKTASQYFKDLREALRRRGEREAYVSCFCQDPDLLEQWRGYGANGSGVSLAVDPSFFYESCSRYRSMGIFALWDVTYDEARQRRIMQKVVDLGVSYRADEEEWTSNERARVTAFALHFFALTFKNPAFEAEKEWRLIYSPSSRVKQEVTVSFRAKGSLLIPFIKLQHLRAAFPSVFDGLGKLPLRAVTIGPSPNMDLTRKSVKHLVGVRGYRSVNINTSSVPYRG